MPLRTYIKNQITNKRGRLNGVRPSTQLPAKAKLQHRFSDHRKFSSQQLPPKVNLRFEMTPVEDQSSVGSW